MNYILGQAIQFQVYPEPRREGVITRTPVGESPYYQVTSFGEVILVDETDILGVQTLPDIDDPGAVEAWLEA